eukprot:snap_masked-scaffold_44-processed-gene-1.13-mRNA-1 protein AED:1.00 eAED:1.00 QI:0/0/0/0/1/1/2/0/935
MPYEISYKSVVENLDHYDKDFVIMALSDLSNLLADSKQIQSSLQTPLVSKLLQHLTKQPDPQQTIPSEVPQLCLKLIPQLLPYLTINNSVKLTDFLLSPFISSYQTQFIDLHVLSLKQSFSHQSTKKLFNGQELFNRFIGFKSSKKTYEVIKSLLKNYNCNKKVYAKYCEKQLKEEGRVFYPYFISTAEVLDGYDLRYLASIIDDVDILIAVLKRKEVKVEEGNEWQEISDLFLSRDKIDSNLLQAMGNLISFVPEETQLSFFNQSRGVIREWLDANKENQQMDLSEEDDEDFDYDDFEEDLVEDYGDNGTSTIKSETLEAAINLLLRSGKQEKLLEEVLLEEERAQLKIKILEGGKVLNQEIYYKVLFTEQNLDVILKVIHIMERDDLLLDTLVEKDVFFNWHIKNSDILVYKRLSKLLQKKKCTHYLRNCLERVLSGQDINASLVGILVSNLEKSSLGQLQESLLNLLSINANDVFEAVETKDNKLQNVCLRIILKEEEINPTFSTALRILSRWKDENVQNVLFQVINKLSTVKKSWPEDTLKDLFTTLSNYKLPDDQALIILNYVLNYPVQQVERSIITLFRNTESSKIQAIILNKYQDAANSLLPKLAATGKDLKLDLTEKLSSFGLIFGSYSLGSVCDKIYEILLRHESAKMLERKVHVDCLSEVILSKSTRVLLDDMKKASQEQLVLLVEVLKSFVSKGGNISIHEFEEIVTMERKMPDLTLGESLMLSSRTREKNDLFPLVLSLSMKRGILLIRFFKFVEVLRNKKFLEIFTSINFSSLEISEKEAWLSCCYTLLRKNILLPTERVLENIFSATVKVKELQIVVNLGPFKQKTDLGLDSRKLSYQILILLRKKLNQDTAIEEIVLRGLEDVSEVQRLAMQLGEDVPSDQVTTKMEQLMNVLSKKKEKNEMEIFALVGQVLHKRKKLNI